MKKETACKEHSTLLKDTESSSKVSGRYGARSILRILSPQPRICAGNVLTLLTLLPSSRPHMSEPEGEVKSGHQADLTILTRAGKEGMGDELAG